MCSVQRVSTKLSTISNPRFPRCVVGNRKEPSLARLLSNHAVRLIATLERFGLLFHNNEAAKQNWTNCGTVHLAWRSGPVVFRASATYRCRESVLPEDGRQVRFNGNAFFAFLLHVAKDANRPALHWKQRRTFTNRARLCRCRNFAVCRHPHVCEHEHPSGARTVQIPSDNSA